MSDNFNKEFVKRELEYLADAGVIDGPSSLAPVAGSAVPKGRKVVTVGGEEWATVPVASGLEREVARLTQLVSDMDVEQQRLREVASWAQAVLTALNVGDVKRESPLHLKLREVMIAFRSRPNPKLTDPKDAV